MMVLIGYRLSQARLHAILEIVNIVIQGAPIMGKTTLLRREKRGKVQ